VEPGDMIVADIDGVAVVPQSALKKVKRQVTRIRDIENEVKGRIAQGESMRDLFPRLAQKFDTD
ncbi:MAG: 4-carboxy-4-hydroxy-2-oxoadipate aldolase/oxaloacetate decarboxylase, partial [Nitrospinae bacterium]|nr:4-carboxy-4-hydroxy-2-oxoadipate aldolase/oxaloacetate decarboxylase [Nitrospinota bacterium]